MDFRVPNFMLPALKKQQADKNSIIRYRIIVGLLIYTTTMTHLDLGYKLDIISQYYVNSNSTYVIMVIQTLRYVHDSLYNGFIYIDSKSKIVNYTNIN